MAVRSTPKPGWNGQGYMLLKADAGHIPLADNSVDLVIATPPYIGVRRVRRGEYCTRDPIQHDQWIKRILTEATRVVKPRGYILLHTRRPQPRRVKIFDVFQKCNRTRPGAAVRVRSEPFSTRFMTLNNFRWLALSTRLYRALIRRYARPGETLAHVFSGSGNSAIAALELGRRPILIDLHYHRRVRRRLGKALRAM